MKVGLLILACSVISAIGVTLAWDPNPEPDVSGYIVHWGTNSRSYSRLADVGNVTNWTGTNLFAGATNFFAVTAYNTSGLESDFSNEVSSPPLPVPPSPPRNLRLSLESAPGPGGPWKEETCVDFADTSASTSRFYRGKVLVE